MFAFLFGGIESVRQSMTDHPRVAVLFGAFFFLLCAVSIGLWEAPGRNVTQSLGMVRSESECVWRTGMIGLPSGRKNPLLNDQCGEEAKAWANHERDRFALADAKWAEPSDNALNEEIVSMTEGYPIEQMAESIAKYDRAVAALLVGIAKKESNWGKRVPRSDDGTDCFNYWGFKGAGSRGVAMGHGCFGSPEEAVEAVGNRVAELVRLRSTSEPKDFTIWKCGSSCATHSPESVRKWVSDVDQYYRVLAIR